MTSWLISIVGVIALNILIDFLLTSEKESKLIKNIFSVVTVIVIITPVISFIKSDVDLEEYFNSIDTINNYENTVNIERNAYYVDVITKALESIKCENVNVYIFNKNSNNYEVNRIVINMVKNKEYSDEYYKNIVYGIVGKIDVYIC